MSEMVIRDQTNRWRSEPGSLEFLWMIQRQVLILITVCTRRVWTWNSPVWHPSACCQRASRRCWQLQVRCGFQTISPPWAHRGSSAACPLAGGGNDGSGCHVAPSQSLCVTSLQSSLKNTAIYLDSIIHLTNKVTGRFILKFLILPWKQNILFDYIPFKCF